MTATALDPDDVPDEVPDAASGADDGPGASDGPPDRAARRDLVLAATRWYLVNRAITAVGLWLSVSLAGARFGWRTILTTGDGVFYIDIARYGYFDIPELAPGERIFTSIGFFPLLPGLIRGLDPLLPGDGMVAGLVISLLAGWAACVAVTLLAREVYDQETARRAAALIACFPGAFAFTFIYTEGLMLTGAAACLLLLRRERWLLAGVAGALATAARPSGVAVVVAGLAVAAAAIHRDRAWRTLLAPAVSSVGMASYLAWLWVQTGSPTAWFENQRDFWNQRNDLGGYLVGWIPKLWQGGYQPTDHHLHGVVVLALVPILWYFYRHRPDFATTAYVTASLVITLSSSLGPRPRFLLAAFPLLLPFAHRWRGERHTALVGAGMAILAFTTVYYAAGIPLSIEHFIFNGPVP